MHSHENGDRWHDSNEHGDNDGSWSHSASSEEDRSGHDSDCSHESHEGGAYRYKMCFMFVFIVGVAVIILIALCCCKKKKRRNMSVANLRVMIRPAQPRPEPAADPMPEKSMKHWEALQVAPVPATDPQLNTAFGVPPPEYMSTLDLQALPTNPTDARGVVTPPPAYEVNTSASPI